MIKFEDIKDEILESLKEKLKNTSIENGFTLIEGFMTFPIREEFPVPIFVFGGWSIPIIGIIDNTSGQIYTYSLKLILPKVGI